jgi:CBS domain-containing protein
VSTILVRTGLKEIITIFETGTVEDALALLKERNVKSVPVRSADGKIVGILGIFDLLTYAVFGVLTSDESYASHADLTRLSNPVGNLVGLTNEGKSAWSFKPYSTNAELWNCLYPFCAGVHRVVVLDESNGEEHLLSQTDVVRYLLAQSALDATLSRSIDALEMVCGPEKVRSIAYHAPALRCYRRMVMEDITSIAIVDESGKLVANLSASDLRGLNRSSFQKLDEQVLKYLAEGRGGEVRAPVTCTAWSTLREVMQKMLIEGVHRVWVTNEAGEPVGQVSMSDVIRVLAPVDWRAPGEEEKSS